MLVSETLRLRRCRHVSAQEIQGGAVLLNLQTGRCWQTNRLGVEVWSMIERDLTFGDICRELSERYQVSREILDKDVGDLVQQLQREGLLEEAVTPHVPEDR